MKQLTIAVPAYNSEMFLHICLDSMAGADDRLEVIVINDGSKDKTLEVANSYAEKYPDSSELKEIEEKQYLGVTEPVEVANTIAFLLSDAAKTITGTTILIDGGISQG